MGSMSMNTFDGGLGSVGNIPKCDFTPLSSTCPLSFTKTLFAETLSSGNYDVSKPRAVFDTIVIECTVIATNVKNEHN